MDSRPFLKCVLLVVHFLMRPTHPFFWGPLAPEDLVPCPSHEHQSKHFDRKRWPSVSWHCHCLLPPLSCCLSPLLQEHEVEQSIPSVRSYTHEQKHPDKSICSPFAVAAGNRRMSWDRKSKSHLLTRRVQVGPEFPIPFSFENSHFPWGGGRRARAVAIGTT